MMLSQQRKQAQAIQLLQDGHIEKAKLLLEKLLKKQPNDYRLMMSLATAQERLGNLQSAENSMRCALSCQTEMAETYFRLGANLRNQGRYQDAVLSIRKALQLAPDHAPGHDGLGELLYMLGGYQAAIECHQRAVELKPGMAHYHFNLGNALYRAGKLPEALAALQNSLSLNSGLPETHCRCGDVLIGIGKLDEAMAHYDHAATISPKMHAAIVGQANVWSQRRQIDKAIDVLAPHAQSLTASTGMACAYGMWVTNNRDVKRAISWIEHLDNLPDHADYNRAQMLFSLGRLYDHCTRYDKAFRCYERANALRHVPYNPNQIEAAVSGHLNVFSKEFLTQTPRAENREFIPIFIIGMPRSGSSLVEQILATHSLVDAAGEQLHMTNIASQFSGNQSSVELVTADSLNNLASAYLTALGDKIGQARYFTDKLPFNFMNIGMIELLFPQAKIIHIRRNVADTCLSCFYQNFSSSQAYSFSLKGLGHFYSQYRRVMAHWSEASALPVYNMDYEKLVACPEQQIRELLEFCNLSFESDCLNFHENQRVVPTASVYQVAKPMYCTSVNRWQLYREHLQPLFSELGDKVLKEYNIDNSSIN